MQFLDPAVVIDTLDEPHRPTARIVAPRHVDGVEPALEHLSEYRDRLVEGIALILFAVPVDVGVGPRPVPYDPGFRGEDLLRAVVGGVQFSASQIVLSPNVGDDQAVHHAVAIEVVGNVLVQGIDDVHDFLVGNQAVVIIGDRNGALAFQTLERPACFARGGSRRGNEDGCFRSRIVDLPYGSAAFDENLVHHEINVRPVDHPLEVHLVVELVGSDTAFEMLGQPGCEFRVFPGLRTVASALSRFGCPWRAVPSHEFCMDSSFDA